MTMHDCDPPYRSEQHLAIVREAFASQILAVAGVHDNHALHRAFACVPRELHMMTKPWQIAKRAGYLPLPCADPVLVYQDVPLSLSREKGINNVRPAIQARWIHNLELKEGDQVVHVGAGTGYYTAIISQIVGQSGRVIAVEIDSALADFSRRQLSHLSNVVVINGDGSGFSSGEVDCIFVNFSVERPASAWLDFMKVGGRLLFALGVPPRIDGAVVSRHLRYGAALRVVRLRSDSYSADCIGPAFFVRADAASSGVWATGNERSMLSKAFESGGVEFVRSLRWRKPPTSSGLWYAGNGWSLSYDDAG